MGDKNIQEQKYDLFVDLGVPNPNINSVYRDHVSVFQRMNLKFFTISAKLHLLPITNVNHIAEIAASILLNLTGWIMNITSWLLLD